MTDEQIIKTIDDVLVEEFELDPKDLQPDVHLFDDLKLDSLDIVDMIIVLEGAFSFKIREDPELKNVRTLGDIHQFVIGKKHLLNDQD